MGRTANNLADPGTAQSGLDSLSITGFRGIDQLEIPRLGHVALLAGRNGVGKTTVLEALRVYAARGGSAILREMLSLREELTELRYGNEDPVYAPAVDRLFHQNGAGGTAIAIGQIDGDVPTLTIEDVRNLSEVPDEVASRFGADDFKALRVVFAHTTSFYSWPGVFASPRGRWGRITQTSDQEETPSRCELLGPGLLGSSRLARLWDKVALTDAEGLALDALRLVFGDRIERAAVIGEDVPGSRGYGSHRRVVVKLSDHDHPVPLRSLGDGATRMFGVALALANCRDGILLIDEVENGIHYTLQSKFWNVVFRTAHAHNTQVVATTHSKDCINGFAAAALACPDVDGNLVRLGRRNGKLRAVEYSTEELKTAAEQNIEVR